MLHVLIQNEEGKLMFPREQNYLASLFTALGIWLLFILAVSSEETMHFRAAVGQQEDQQNVINYTESASNQTGNTGNLSSALVDTPQEPQTMENQKGIAALSANLSQSDFETLTQDLVEARQALENNDTTTLFDELNSASGELFQVISGQFDPAQVEAITQEFSLMQTHIDRAQETALKDNHTGTLEELRAAESELSTIIQMLPSSQE
jgi:hypothetical protein